MQNGDSGFKRKADCLRQQLDENTQQRANAVIHKIKNEYATHVTELATAYEKVLKKTKEEHWLSLVKMLGNEVLDAMGIDYNTFFISTGSTRAREGTFSLLSSSSQPANKRYRSATETQGWSNRSSGDEADADDDDDENEAEDFKFSNQLVLKELQTNKHGVVVRLIPGTQFTTPGGNTACTAIAFAAAYRMSRISNIEILEHEVNWPRVLVLGTEIWTIWKKTNPNQDGRYLINVEDIRTMPFLSRVFGKVWETLNQTETEKVGYINDEINQGLGGEAGGVINLRDALDSMQPCADYPNTAVAVICGGAIGKSNSSLALWKNKANHFALYNSHGGQAAKHSSLYLMRDLAAATYCIRSILSRMPQTQLDRRIAGQTSCVLYSMQILRFEFTNVDLAYS